MQHHPSESFVTRFESLAGTSTKRHVDLELRFLDVIFALVFGLLTVPLALVIGAVVTATSGLPVLYRGERVGRGGRIFTILKFRTLRRDAETRLGPYLGEELVRRTELEYTRAGRALKASQLDELPQLWNVLRGDMSFVGPRPIPRASSSSSPESCRRTGSASSSDPGSPASRRCAAATRRRWRRSSRTTSNGSPIARCASTSGRSSRRRCASYARR